MPSIVTHHYFSKDVYDKLDNSIKDKINLDIYHIFAQSFDNFYYYKLTNPFSSYGKEIRKLGEIGQRTNINLYYKNIIKYIDENNLRDNKDVLSYLYGSILHYVLDKNCHPLIIYTTGMSSVDNKYRGGHEKMEVSFDAYMYNKKTGKDLYKAKLGDMLLPRVKFSSELKNCVTYTFKNTYKVDNIGNVYNKSVNSGNFLLKYFVTDRIGFKRFIYSIVDKLNRYGRMYSNLSFHVKNIDTSLFNLNHGEWCNPIDKKLISTLSFLDLYNESITEGVYKISSINDYFNNKISLDKVLEIIGNNSHVTGVDFKDKRKSIYFKY